MNELSIRNLLWPWALLAITALDWWLAWGRFGERVVMKYGPSGAPIAWAPKHDAMTFDLALVGGMVTLVTVIVVLVDRLQPERARKVYVGATICASLVCLLVNGLIWYRMP